MSESKQLQRYCANGLLALLLVSGSACWAENEKATTSNDYRIVDLKPAQVNVDHLGLTACTGMFALSATRVLAACRSAKSDTAEDSGLRLFILATEVTKASILSATRGLGDAYSVVLQQRVNEAGKYKNLILADAAAEYAYGTAVYQLDGDKLNYLGDIGYVQMSAEENAISALNITTLQASKDGFKVSFSKDVHRMDNSGKYQRMDARKAAMLYDGKKLK